MKCIATSLLVTQAAAFAFVGNKARMPTSFLAAEYQPMEGEGKINLKVRMRLYNYWIDNDCALSFIRHYPG